jgi:hypothetical protein
MVYCEVHGENHKGKIRKFYCEIAIERGITTHLGFKNFVNKELESQHNINDSKNNFRMG